MDIQEFIAQCEGSWFAQRTSYDIGQEKFDNGQTVLKIDVFSSEHPQLQELCQQHQIPDSIGGMKTSWTSGQGTPPEGSLVLVFTAETSHRGKLIQIAETSSPTRGCYRFGDDEALTLMLTQGTTAFEERLWFASPNLRLRTSVCKQADGFRTTSFYSEIRKLPPKPAAG